LRADDEMPLNQPQTLKVEKIDQILLVTLARPEARNALDITMMSELRSLWSSLPLDLRCIVITGDGPGFCAGADMSLLESDRGDAAASAAEELSFLPGAHVDVPVIAAVNGVCAGGGLHFVADADIVIASSAATFVDPHVSVGQASVFETIALAKKSPMEAVMRMAFTGRHERLSARRAYELGICSQVVDPPERLDAEAQALGELIARNSPAALAHTKRALWSALERVGR
jgi:enoyl-CoA hydratase/carnithine racemase